MKRLFISAMLMVAIATIGKAQTSSSAFKNGDNLFQVGIGVGSPFFGYGYSSSLPFNPTISYEKGITDQISAGGIISFASSKYQYNGFTVFKQSATYIGARGAYHVNQYLNLGDNVDLYGGVSLGVVIVNTTDEGTIKDQQGNTLNFSQTGSGVGFGLYAGGKYYFQPNFGVYAEVGYQSLSFLNLGVTFKF